MKKHLGSVTPRNTDNNQMLTALSNKVTVVESIDVCNTGSSAVVIRIFYGRRDLLSSLGVGNALYYDVPINGNSTFSIEPLWYVDETHCIAVRTSIASVVTFTAFGDTIDT